MEAKKQIKALKKRIVNESALNVGYNFTIFQKLPVYAITQALKEISANDTITDESEIKNIFITEAIKNTNYQDFKEIAPCFFGY